MRTAQASGGFSWSCNFKCQGYVYIDTKCLSLTIIFDRLAFADLDLSPDCLTRLRIKHYPFLQPIKTTVCEKLAFDCSSGARISFNGNRYMLTEMIVVQTLRLSDAPVLITSSYSHK